jgi:hypothetical protein
MLVFRVEMGRNNHPRKLTDMDYINAAWFMRIARNHLTVNPHRAQVDNEGVGLSPVIALTAGRGCQEHKHNQYNARQMRLHSRTPEWRNDWPRAEAL